MTGVLISIQPRWCELIASGSKTVEIRKNRPRLPVPFKCYIYQTKARWAYALLRRLALDDLADWLARGTGKIIGEFVCDQCQEYDPSNIVAAADLSLHSQVPIEEIRQYAKGRKSVSGWHISSVKLYDTPKPLAYLIKPAGADDPFLKCAPQSWCYVMEREWKNEQDK